jgi:hypothetical protein
MINPINWILRLNGGNVKRKIRIMPLAAEPADQFLGELKKKTSRIKLPDFQPGS